MTISNIENEIYDSLSDDTLYFVLSRWEQYVLNRIAIEGDCLAFSA
jgi:hypothetical protein